MLHTAEAEQKDQIGILNDSAVSIYAALQVSDIAASTTILVFIEVIAGDS
jgi:hypothetical protein